MLRPASSSARPSYRVWTLSVPDASDSSDAKRHVVGRLHILVDNSASADRSEYHSRTGMESEPVKDDGLSTKKRRSVTVTHPALWFEYDAGWLRDGFALSYDLPLKEGPILPPTGSRNFSAFLDLRPDAEVRLLAEEAEAHGAALDWRLEGNTEELLTTCLAHPDAGLGGFAWTLATARGLSPVLLEKRLATRPPLPHYQQAGDELLYAHHAYERGRAKRDELLLLLSAKTLPGRGAPYTVLFQKRPAVLTIANGSDPYHRALWRGFSLEIARAVGIRTVSPTLRHMMGEAVLLTSRADRDGGDRPLAALSARALIAPKGNGQRAGLTYADIVSFLTREGAAPKEDLPEVWRRMAFTLLTGPTGDKPERWLFVRPAGEESLGWRLAPAHSLTFTSPTLVARGGMRLRPGMTRFTSDEAITVAPYFDLTRQEAKHFVLSVRRKLLDWEADALEYGIPSRDLPLMRECFED